MGEAGDTATAGGGDGGGEVTSRWIGAGAVTGMGWGTTAHASSLVWMTFGSIWLVIRSAASVVAWLLYSGCDGRGGGTIIAGCVGINMEVVGKCAAVQPGSASLLVTKDDVGLAGSSSGSGSKSSCFMLSSMKLSIRYGKSTSEATRAGSYAVEPHDPKSDREAVLHGAACGNANRVSGHDLMWCFAN